MSISLLLLAAKTFGSGDATFTLIGQSVGGCRPEDWRNHGFGHDQPRSHDGFVVVNRPFEC